MYAVEWLEKLDFKGGWNVMLYKGFDFLFFRRVGKVRITFYGFEESSV